MWAALLHDIGKPDTTKQYKGRITSYDHDKAGALIARKFYQNLLVMKNL
jgi:putative nucleotidyltransferase with HDIG domain